jgi:hypothetical protein
VHARHRRRGDPAAREPRLAEIGVSPVGLPGVLFSRAGVDGDAPNATSRT